jgi:RNA polymerase primary sigma factor
MDNDLVELFLQDAGKHPLLNPQQERGLACVVQRGLRATELLMQGGGSEAQTESWIAQARVGRQARDAFILHNIQLVLSALRKFQPRLLAYPEYISEGIEGLCRAIDKFDHRRGLKFSTYAHYWIRQAFQRANANQSTTVRQPVHAHELTTKVKRVEQELWQELQRAPTMAEHADRVGMTRKRLSDHLYFTQSQVRLDAPMRDDEGDGATRLDVLATGEMGPDELHSHSHLKESLKEALALLLPREEQVLTLRFGLITGVPLTLAEVAAKYGLTRERIRQIEQDGLRKLRSAESVKMLSNWVYPEDTRRTRHEA